jgi:hypothetical protein
MKHQVTSNTGLKANNNDPVTCLYAN